MQSVNVVFISSPRIFPFKFGTLRFSGLCICNTNLNESGIIKTIYALHHVKRRCMMHSCGECYMGPFCKRQSSIVHGVSFVGSKIGYWMTKLPRSVSVLTNSVHNVVPNKHRGIPHVDVTCHISRAIFSLHPDWLHVTLISAPHALINYTTSSMIYAHSISFPRIVCDADISNHVATPITRLFCPRGTCYHREGTFPSSSLSCTWRWYHRPSPLLIDILKRLMPVNCIAWVFYYSGRTMS